MGNILGAARLSRKTDESTSIERQIEQITYTAKARGDNLVHTTEDSDVSGGISPFAREGLGPWLTDPEKINQWDTLIIPKLDRLTRSLKHFDEIVEWCDRNGKTLVSVSEALDLSTSTGRMFANILAMFAQFERERIGERRREAGVKMRENGWWQGGQAPYGYRPVKVDSHWELREDPTQRGILERIASHLIAGMSRRSIGRSLDADGIPTPKNAKAWGERTITLILKKIINDDDPILDQDTRAKVAEKLEDKSVGWTKRGESPLFLNVAYCPCGKPLYSRRWENKTSGKLYEYYRCADKCQVSKDIPMTELDAVAEMLFTSPEYGQRIPVVRVSVQRGRSAKAEMKAIERQMDTLDKTADDYISQITELAAELKRLRNASTTADQYSETDTGLTLAGYWPTIDREAKRQLLLDNEVKLTDVTRGGGQVEAVVPDRFVIRSEV
jgi:DNA invertase Pin-like site-specific DNA recombinase